MASNAAEITDRRQLPIVFNVYNHARRAEFKHLPSESNRSWRTAPVDRPAYAMPPAPHETYCDYLQGKISDRWLNLSWSTGQKGEYEPRAHVSGWKAA